MLGESKMYQNQQHCLNDCKGITGCSLVAGKDLLLEPYKYSGYACHKNFLFLYDYLSSISQKELLVYHHYLTGISNLETAGMIGCPVNEVEAIFNNFINGYIVYLRYMRFYKFMPISPDGFDKFIDLLINNGKLKVGCALKNFHYNEKVNLTFYEFLKSIDVRLRVTEAS